ncbi:MAG: DNA mismatch endonuclease Vsr [Deltaproteobacteria bacterium]|nr:DNA mismatch endonuclease Vsr [Deltaproteobacteria bacterium]
MDPLSPEQRSYTMSRVHGKDTRTEMLVRRLLYSLGYRYRLQGRDLPGNPDIVFRSKKKVIFIHGCFWHGHDCRSGKKRPKSNEEYWLPKLAKTKSRDAHSQEKLLELGWDYLILWECQLKNKEALIEKIRIFMEGKSDD